MDADDLAIREELGQHVQRDAIIAVDFKKNPWSPENAPRLNLEKPGF